MMDLRKMNKMQKFEVHNKMSAKIKIRELDGLQNYMDQCMDMSDSDEAPSYRYKQPMSRILTEPPKRQRNNLVRSVSRIQIRRKVTNPVLSKSYVGEKRENSQPLIDAYLKRKDKFCGDVVVNKIFKTSFKHVLRKYKKNYHPTNASRGSRDTSNQKIRQSHKINLFKNDADQQTFRDELRKMTVLSQVIMENTKKQAKIFQQKSMHRHKITT